MQVLEVDPRKSRGFDMFEETFVLYLHILLLSNGWHPLYINMHWASKMGVTLSRLWTTPWLSECASKQVCQKGKHVKTCACFVNENYNFTKTRLLTFSCRWCSDYVCECTNARCCPWIFDGKFSKTTYNLVDDSGYTNYEQIQSY